MSLLTVLVWRAAATAPDGRLHLTVLEVGSGNGLLVQTPEGRYLLIDGGPSPSALSQGLGRRLPFYHHRIDYLVIAAPVEEQVGSLPEVIERDPPENVLWAGAPQATSASRYLQRTLNQLNIQPLTALEGQRLELGQGASLRVLKTSQRGAVLLLKWRSFQVLLPIGMDFETLTALQ
jgi:competence protein ComEC